MGGFLKMEQLMGAVMILYVVICPYTKVEESFNIQAFHDVLFHGLDIKSYDHQEFPGVVPRSFVGPIFVSIAAAPLVYITTFLESSKFFTQYIVRAFLGIFVLFGVSFFANGVEIKFGTATKRWFYLITMSQFHFMFYMSRPLPNVFALSLVMLAVGAWLQRKHGQFIWYSGSAIIIFRAELCLYLGLILLMELIAGRLAFRTLLKHIIPAGILLLGTTVLIDSVFWGRWLWPEGEVLWYNTILNKSSNWGTEPFLWYFSSVLPRALGFSLLLVPLGLYLNPVLRTLLLPAVGFVFLYSFLPHKELRFIIYVFPVLNVAAAEAVSRLWRNRSKSNFQKLIAAGAALHIGGNLLTTSLFLYISYHNYPGGTAMYRLHQLVPPDRDVHVHIDVPTAQTGVTRFTQVNNNWIYNKTEDLEPGGNTMMSYTHLLFGVDAGHSVDIYKDSHTILSQINGFDSIQLTKNIIPIKILTSPKIFIGLFGELGF